MMIEISLGDSRPIFRQIVDEFQRRIVSGEMSTGEKLPSVRGLAMQLTINSSTVARAYSELTTLGLVESQPGRGLFVAERRQILSDEERTRRLHEALNTFIRKVTGLEFATDEILNELRPLLQQIHGEQSEDRKRA